MAVKPAQVELDLAEVGRHGCALDEVFDAAEAEVKEIEHNEFMQVISPWEREHLLLHV